MGLGVCAVASCPDPNKVCQAGITGSPATYGGAVAGITDVNGYHDPCAINDGSGNNTLGVSGDIAPDTGNNGQPGYCAYYLAAKGAMAATDPVLTVLIPVLLLMLAIWQGPAIIKRLALHYSQQAEDARQDRHTAYEKALDRQHRKEAREGYRHRHASERQAIHDKHRRAHEELLCAADD